VGKSIILSGTAISYKLLKQQMITYNVAQK